MSLNQRYEVRATGWPKEGDSMVGLFDDLHDAALMLKATLSAPGCISACVFDRQDNAEVITAIGSGGR